MARSSSLSGAFDIVTTGFERTRGIPVELDITGTEFQVNEPVEHGILRTCQEALANIARHSKATRVHITLSYLEDTIALDIADNGVGAGDHPPRTGGQGLQIMRQRIAELGGTVEMDTDS
ncbi:sensor histidine kinase [Kocuria atrinae]|uniref:sensor histidine kinase n=1 Tax=Kocuria atrinae TaxID=592377 RepID=UPI0002D4C421|nr:ATP-binding protein [Kocuria atrinae]